MLLDILRRNLKRGDIETKKIEATASVEANVVPSNKPDVINVPVTDFIKSYASKYFNKQLSTSDVYTIAVDVSPYIKVGSTAPGEATNILHQYFGLMTQRLASQSNIVKASDGSITNRGVARTNNFTPLTRPQPMINAVVDAGVFRTRADWRGGMSKTMEHGTVREIGAGNGRSVDPENAPAHNTREGSIRSSISSCQTAIKFATATPEQISATASAAKNSMAETVRTAAFEGIGPTKVNPDRPYDPFRILNSPMKDYANFCRDCVWVWRDHGSATAGSGAGKCYACKHGGGGNGSPDFYTPHHASSNVVVMPGNGSSGNDTKVADTNDSAIIERKASADESVELIRPWLKK